MLRCLMPASYIPSVEYHEEQNEYGFFINDAKQREFGVIGRRPVQELIQAEYENCDYRLIMQSLNPSVVDYDLFDSTLEVAQSISDPNDALLYGELLRDNFIKMPLEVKKKYANNYELFTADLLSGGFANYIAENFEKQSVVENPVVDSQKSVSDEAGRVAELERQLDELRKTVGKTESEVK